MTASNTPNTPDDADGMDPQYPRKTPQPSGPAEQAEQPEPAPEAEPSAPAPQSAPGSPDRSEPGGTVRPRGGRPDALLLDDELGETADEAVLRLLMRDAVSELQGSPDALDYLRRAVPARRQRHRQALVGACAVVLLACMAVPALLRVTGTPGGTDHAATGLASAHTGAPDEDGQTSSWGDYPGTSAGPVSPGPDDVPTSQSPTAGAGSAPANPPVTTSGTALAAPECASSQLGQGTSQADAPDSDGLVYGWFRVANVSDSACTVPNGGMVQAVAQGAADPSRIQVVNHTQGDAATALPTASTTGPVVLNPGDDYEVEFAWVPASGAGAGGCPVTPTASPTTPTPTDSPTESPTTTGGTDPDTTGNSASTQLGNDAPASPDSGSIALNHTPAAGAPVVTGPVIQGACAGTVYTTPAIPEQTATPAS